MAGDIIIISGKHSSLPKSISMLSTILEKSENIEKLSIGPILLIPGPILFTHVVTAVKLVAKSKLFSEISNSDATIMPK